MSNEWWRYENLNPAPPEGYDWYPAGRGDHPHDNIDFHVDLGAGRLPKGRLRIDRHGDAELLMDLDKLTIMEHSMTAYKPGSKKYRELYNPKFINDKGAIPKLPFPDNSIESMISHHCLEHIHDGFMNLMDECYRVLKQGAIFRIIVPLFPSISAVSDPDHKRYFCENTFESFTGREGQDFWSDVFAEPYTKCRFQLVDKQITLPREDLDLWHPDNAREIRVSLKK
jgi:SAM-dependent methyltransferase